MDRYLLISLAMALFACGPDADELVRAENKKLDDMQAAENSRTEGVLARIRYDAEIIAKGGTPDTLSTTVIPASPSPDAVPALSSNPSDPYAMQVGAFRTMESARVAQALWSDRGFTHAVAMENSKATTVYRFVVRIPGFDGYHATVQAAEKINQKYGIRAFPVEMQ